MNNRGEGRRDTWRNTLRHPVRSPCHGDPATAPARSRGPQSVRRRSVPASVLPRRPAQPAEIAQARVFERLLQAECAELQELAHRMSGGTYQQPQPDDSRPSGELTQIRARIDEVDGLLRALRGRFPHAVPDGDRYPA